MKHIPLSILIQRRIVFLSFYSLSLFPFVSPLYLQFFFCQSMYLSIFMVYWSFRLAAELSIPRFHTLNCQLFISIFSVWSKICMNIVRRHILGSFFTLQAAHGIDSFFNPTSVIFLNHSVKISYVHWNADNPR